VWPDGKYFESPRVPMNELERLLRSKAVLLSGVAVRLDIEQANGPALSKTWSYPEGLAGYLKELAGDVEAVAPIFTADKYAGKDDPTFAAGEGAAWALAWFESAVPSESYVNLIPR
jgi:DNA topoisomerase IV subunit B (EC 5.99.1.3)